MTDFTEYTINVRVPVTPYPPDSRELCRQLEAACRVAVRQVADAKAEVEAEPVVAGCEHVSNAEPCFDCAAAAMEAPCAVR